jgi:hypothetical protein
MTSEERERMKRVLNVDDAGLDAWVVDQTQKETADRSCELTDRELQALEHQKRLFAACWDAADAVIKVPVDHPQMNLDTVWRITTDVAIALYEGLERERTKHP